MRMIQAGNHLRFALEALLMRSVRRKLRLKKPSQGEPSLSKSRIVREVAFSFRHVLLVGDE